MSSSGSSLREPRDSLCVRVSRSAGHFLLPDGYDIMLYDALSCTSTDRNERERKKDTSPPVHLPLCVLLTSNACVYVCLPLIPFLPAINY